MEKQIAESLAVCDLVRGHKRSQKKLWLSFDEWNVWYRTTGGDDVNGHRKEAPHLLEEVYNLEDALLIGGLVNSLLRNADRVKIACLAQLINVIAPIMTDANGLYRQTIYYPYAWGLQFAKGSVLNLLVESSTYDVSGMDQVARTSTSPVYKLDAKSGKLSAVPVESRLVEAARSRDRLGRYAAPAKVISSSILTGDDLKASNSFAAPKACRATIVHMFRRAAGIGQRFELPARSSHRCAVVVIVARLFIGITS